MTTGWPPGVTGLGRLRKEGKAILEERDRRWIELVISDPIAGSTGMQ